MIDRDRLNKLLDLVKTKSINNMLKMSDIKNSKKKVITIYLEIFLYDNRSP